MDTSECIRHNREAIKAGIRAKIFDWDKAARLISENRKTNEGNFLAVAGLIEDFKNTGGIIFDGVKDEMVTDSYPYLYSNWATPVIVFAYIERLGPKPNPYVYDCWKYEDETDWDEHTNWPQSAIDILEGKK